MPCDFFVHFFSRVLTVINSDHREKTAARQFIIVFLTIDKGKSPSIIFHNCFGIITTSDRF